MKHGSVLPYTSKGKMTGGRSAQPNLCWTTPLNKNVTNPKWLRTEMSAMLMGL